MNCIKNKKIELLSWIVLTLLSIVLYFAATDFFVFPIKMKVPLLLSLLIVVCVCGLFNILAKGRCKIAAIIINSIFVICLLCALFFLPYFEGQVKSIFKDTTTAEAVINVYALCDEKRSVINEFNDALFAVQDSMDLDNQAYAIEEIQNEIGLKSLKTYFCDDVVSAANALYEKQSDLLILNEVYVDLLEEIEGFEHFLEETKIIYSIKREMESEAESLLPVRTDITDTPFTIYIAGCDTRSGRLTIYGRTDVNILLNVNPNTHQILIIGIPRDTYIPNPALDYGYDKLTHLGNNGIYNTMKGVGEFLDIEINYYGEVIFDTFKRIIDAVGGIDVDNPYDFSSGKHENNIEYYYHKGNIHLNGEEALLYARTRATLYNGDYGRNEHQTIVLKAFISKLLSPDIINSYDDILAALKGQFMTDVGIEDLFKLANMQLNDGKQWDIITYHLGGMGDMCGTASMGWDRKLYVVHPFASQIEFIKKQIELLKKDETIVQGVLPQNDETTYIPN